MFSFRRRRANGHSSPRDPHENHPAERFENFEKNDKSPAKLLRVAFGAHFAKQFGILDGA